MGPGVIGGEIDGDVVGRLALAQSEADALEILGDVGHDVPPGVVVIENGGGVEAPAGLAGAIGGVGPAMPDELIDALQEVQVGLGFHVERGGAEDRRVQPRPGFGRGDGTVVEMAGGGGPAGGGEGAPLRSFAFGKADQGVARHGDRGIAVGLGAEKRAVFGGPFVDRREVVFVDELGEGFAPVVADGESLVADVSGEGGEVRREVVAAALLKLGEEVGRPVGGIDFQAVAEDGVGRVSPKARAGDRRPL